ncbi:MAG: hypothetical protein J0L83_08635 [Chitinophagales bacterium]|nr:hypothetical protein [Chitinophagales bacterium]
MSLGLLWMAINSTWGIMFGYAFPESKIGLGHIGFYVFFLLSLGAYLWFVIRLWSKPLNRDME